jgi:DNA polymerase I-like protein with 3'-5' exonuclease and polymerase domains
MSASTALATRRSAVTRTSERPRGLADVQLHLVDSLDDALRLKTWLSEDRGRDGVLAFDTESTGLDPAVDRVRLVQVGDSNEGWAIPLDDWRGLVKEVIRDWDGYWVMHNAKFDVAMMSQGEGIEFPLHRVHDTRYMCHILNPLEPTALKTQAAKYIDPMAASMQRQLDDLLAADRYSWATIPITREGPTSVYWIYGALDPVLTHRLFELKYPGTMAEAPMAYDIELAVAWVTMFMERRGVRVDREYTTLKGFEFDVEFNELSRQCMVEWGVKPNASADVIKVLLADGVKLQKFTPGGAYSLDKEVLDSLDHPLANLVKRRRRLEKMQSTYIRRFLEHSERDGRLHPRINTIGGSGKSARESGGMSAVKTSRMSMDTPNLQQLPRGDDDITSAIRNCIVASENSTLVLTDADQIEMRVMAHLSGDEGMQRAFMSDVDFFTALARNVYHAPDLVKSDPRRQVTKNYGYATIYGAGIPKLAKTAGVSEDEIRKLDALFNQAYPGVKAMQRGIEREAMQRLRNEGMAYSRSPLTNRRYAAVEGKEYALVNYTIQGMSAEILKIKLLQLHAAGLGEYMILPVHDEVILDVPDDDLVEVIHAVHDIVNDENLLSIPLTWGVATGKRWGEKRDYELVAQISR